MTSWGAGQSKIGGTVLAIALLMAGNTGCMDFVGVDSEFLSALGLATSPLSEDGGNVVINCANSTTKPVQWRLAWQGASAGEPSRVTVTIEPGKTKTFAMEGNVERIAAGSLDESWSIAAVVDPAGDDPHTVTYGGGVLENGVHFHDGDIIQYNISSTDNRRFRISADVARGG